ncbi:ABC transporter ATP-binding protein [Flexithrix dorotheae]|uniref:ABC transporter ATP-binding protein n=1 Tax=Flexithrix dorotheae TaxID=70993 RepID=UPI000A043FDA|nr:ABC transporter ATP-binding protein [Flexithrix dorotheae]
MKKSLQSLLALLGKWKWQYFSAGMLAIIAIAMSTLEPKVLQVAVDNILVYYQSEGETGHFSTDIFSKAFSALLPTLEAGNFKLILLALGGIYMAIAISRGSLLLFSSSLNAACTESAIKHLRDRLFKHIQELPLSYFGNTSKGELIQRSTGDIDTVRNFAQNQIVEIIRLGSLFIFSFLMMMYINTTFALISIMLVPIIGIGGWFFFNKERKVWEKHEDEADKLNKIVQENLNGIRLVSAFANEEHEIDKFEKQNREKLNIGLQHMLLHTYYWPLSDFLVLAQIVISILVGGYFVIENVITVGELLSSYTYLVMVSWPMRQIGRILSQMGMAIVAMDRITQILDAKPELYEEDGINHGLIKGEISFNNIHFKYDSKAKENVLDGISFKIRKGEKVALVGPTSSGKSTIINLLTRLYDPQQGEILLDGKNIQEFSKPYLRKNIGVVLQKPFLFSTTVAENISYARPEVGREAIEEAARISQIDSIHDILPNGYDTVIGEKGVTLSGGQKQRLSLARTVVSAPDILVLDDITSAVDTATEFAIFKELEKEMENKTTIIISHRITSIQYADRILVLDKGKIVQEGTHAELAGKEGYYKEILNVQSALEEEIGGIL